MKDRFTPIFASTASMFLKNELKFEFSKLSPDTNPSVAKEDMVNIVCFILYKRARSYLLDSVIEQIQLA